jgi:succinate dehydrogenase / fumarate reductase flavoprotein subunit
MDLRRRWRAVRATGGQIYNPGWNLVFELDHLLTVSEAIARSARQRTESRGAHSRLDHPATDDVRWAGVNSVITRGIDGAMSVTTAPLATMSDELRSLLGSNDH